MKEINKDKKVKQLTAEEIEKIRLRYEALNQISLNHGNVPVQAQVDKDGKIISVKVYEKKK